MSRRTKRARADSPASRARRWIIHLGLVGASCLVGLLACELVARSFVDLGSFQYSSDDEKKWNSPLPAVKYVLTPGFRGRLSAPEFEHPIEINSLGFRGPDPGPLDEQEQPLFVIGDSFVFGVGSEYGDTIPARLEHHLNRSRSRSGTKNVWNLGVPGYALQQYSLTLEKYLGLLTPETVVVGLYLGRVPSGANDLTGSVKFERWQQKQGRAGTSLTPEPPQVLSPEKPARAPLRRLQQQLEHRSALYNLLLIRAGPFVRSLAQDRRAFDEETTRQLEEGWRLLDRFLGDLQETADRHAFDVLLVYIPEQPDILAGDRSVSDRLRVLASSYRMPLVDGMLEISSAKSFEFYYPADGHLTPAGNDHLARVIAEALENSVEDQR